MPQQLTYPGVYLEEVPSGVRTIVGVATSVTAFLGRAARGPIDDPVPVRTFGELEAEFGGLSEIGTLGFAVRDFLRNGGSQALVVRLFGGDPAAQTAAVTGHSTLRLQAASPGAWANTLRARVTHDTSAAAAEVADRLGVPLADLFDLAVRDTATGTTEVFRNLTYVAASARRIDLVLTAESRLVRWLPADPPVDPDPPAGHPDPHDDPPTGSPPGAEWAGDAFSTGVDAAVTDGAPLDAAAFTGSGFRAVKRGLYALEKADLFNLLCIPPIGDATADAAMTGIVADAAAYCEERRAVLIVDPPAAWRTAKNAGDAYRDTGTDRIGTRSRNAALFFPRIREANPLHEGRIETFAPCGAVAGVFARTDAARGVWKAPAGLDASVVGVAELAVKLTDAENGDLNPLGINALRTFPAAGTVVWGSRTLAGNDQLASEWKYVPVRRTALFLEESLYRGTQWVVFEPNDEPLWAQIRLSVGAFMQNLFRQGAFQGSSPRDAYFVRCGADTTTQDDVNRGIVNILVGFAPLKPAEFVVVKLQQLAGQIDT
ncbi:MAG: phage tail sheath family protein [Acidimicrobiales bacterium]